MKQSTKRILSLVLCFVMVLGMMPMLSLNANAETTDTVTVPQESVAPATAPEQATSLEDLSVEATANIIGTTTEIEPFADGGNDFPEYPNQGAIRIDKTASAVGTFSQTGITKMELSMTGVPYSTGSEIDMVIVLDASTSMVIEDKGARIAAAKEAAYELVKQTCQNKDGSFNNNRVAIVFFGDNGSANYPVSELALGLGMKYQTKYGYALSNITSMDSIYSVIYDNYPDLGTTNYSNGLAIAEAILTNARTDGTGNNRQQFCVFMSDGAATGYKWVKNYDPSKRPVESQGTTGYSLDSNAPNRQEYFSTQMKYDGVQVYCVGTAMTKESDANAYGFMKNIASSEENLYFVSKDDVAAGALQNVFGDIAVKITQAATDVIVEDQIDDQYTMIFDIPTGPKTITGASDDLCIEFVKYSLDEDNERKGDPTTITKLKLTQAGGRYAADAAAHVFETKTLGDKGTKYYWTTDATKSTDDIEVNGYYFTKNGDGTHNMTSGAYADGSITNNMSNDLVIATPYFVYNASTRMLYWTVDKLDTSEYALRYFLYLNKSATHIGENDVLPAGTYPTNDHANISYTNHLQHDVSKDFPVPRMAWNGAQVSYVFYLVNDDGQPINSAGQVIDFANAVFVTDIFTKQVVWNDTDTPTTDEGTAYLDANYEAGNLLPEGYTPYDAKASYVLKVYEDAEGNKQDSYFTIGGTDGMAGTTKVYNSKAGDKYSDYGTYTSDMDEMANFDFAHTTVAFAVVWSAKLVEDVVVVDFGLDTLIDVTRNDLVTSSVSGIGTEDDVKDYGKEINTGLLTESTGKLGNTPLTIDGNAISIVDRNTIRFHQDDMQFSEPVKFYYESPVTYYGENNTKLTGYMYSSVTVIPATTIYYEDEYVDLKTYHKVYDVVTYTADSSADETYYTQVDGTYTKVETPVVGETYYVATDRYDEVVGWAVDSTSITATQEQDRPGESQISATIDADNNYGSDSAYETMSTYSMDSAAKATVNSGTYATASFEFYGTGFDIISLTSAATGTITINVYDKDNNCVVSESVDTYYGYERKFYDVTYTYTHGEWVETKATQVTAMGTEVEAPAEPQENESYTTCETRWETTASDNTNALFQVPVMKIGDGKTTDPLTFDKYKAVITATYVPFLDHNKTDASYDFYLDAIRIYNPTGNQNDTANDAYVQDGEGYPSYFEVRDQILSKQTYDTLNDNDINGIVFIDGNISAPSIADYTSYGPNNEVYLDLGDAIAFDLNATAVVGTEVAKVQMAIKTVGGTGKVEVYGVENGAKVDCLSETISTATDMYYDITALNGKTVVIKNANTENGAIISITNVKVTYTGAQDGEVTEEAPALFSIRRSTADAAVASMIVEETIPDASEPEIEPSEPEIEPSEPETEPSEPETEPSEPETKPTEPETKPTEPNHKPTVKPNVVNTFRKLIKKFFGWFFG